METLNRTKLYIPTVPVGHISRGRLIDIMDMALVKPLTLVSAPAGYGKSALVSEWLRLREHHAVWLSLNEADSDLRQFISYLVAALEVAHPGACPTVVDLSQTPELPPLPDLGTYLLNDLDYIEEPIVVVLDDYHHLQRSSPVNELLDKLLEHPLSHLHIVLITRRDPGLAMAKLRASGHVVELRMQDLQFTGPETAELLAANLGCNVSNGALANVQSEIEGWAVGLRLMLLAVHHADDYNAALSALHGGVAHLQEYLISEVLDGLPDRIREYLLKSAILDVFCADVIEAVCGAETLPARSELSGREYIDRLERDNLFLIPLDTAGKWFRFHHLFKAQLRNQLLRQFASGDIKQLYERASVWFEDQNLIEEAILYALEADDSNRAADIVERHYREQLNQDRFYIIDKWLSKLPREIKETRATLSICQAWTVLYKQQIAPLTSILDKTESLLDVEDDDDCRIGLRFFRSYLCFWEGDVERSERELESVLASASKENLALIAEAKVHLSLARYMNGRKTIAMRALFDWIYTARDLVLPRMFGTLAIIHLLSGDLYQARLEGKRMRESAANRRSVLNISWGYYLEGLANLHSMNLDAAQDALIAGSEYPYSTDARAAVDSLAGLALTQQFMRQPEAADDTVSRLIDFASKSNDPNLIEVAYSCEVRIDLLRGNLARALKWAKFASHRIERLGLLFWLESPSITKSRILIADGSAASLNQADQLLREIRKLCGVYQFRGQIVEVAVLQALLQRKQGRQDAALAALQEAVDLAESGGWIRPFVEIGRPMADLLEQLDAKGSDHDFISTVLASSDLGVALAPPDKISVTMAKLPGATGERSTAGVTPHDLTNREIDILEMLTQRLQNKEIATKLFISTNTVNYHLKHIYQKLGVGNRRHAVNKAVELGILPLA